MEASWHQNRKKIDANFERPLTKKLFFLAKIHDFEGSRGCKIGGKSLKNQLRPRWNASWHRFLIDFGGCGEASWEGNRAKSEEKAIQKCIG